jgi:RNA polymerase sigma-70 factor (ECF subfamily)
LISFILGGEVTEVFEINSRPMNKEENITQILLELSDGKAAAADALLPVVYDELKRLAASYMRKERANHTLQPTALVHEAYLKLIDQTRVSWQNRAHFFGVAANIMRRILVDYARVHNAEKRGHEFQKLQLNEEIDKADEISTEVLRLDEALQDFARLDPDKARLVELRYFGGLTFEEAAEVLGVSLITVKRHWRVARAYLHNHLTDSE